MVYKKEERENVVVIFANACMCLCRVTNEQVNNDFIYIRGSERLSPVGANTSLTLALLLLTKLDLQYMYKRIYNVQ